MPYFIIAALIVGFASGYGVSHKIGRAEIIGLELAIQQQKTEAQSILQDAQLKVTESENRAIQINNQLDKEHEENTRDIINLHDQLSTVRLRDPGHRPSCPGSVPTSDSAGHAEDSTGSAELSAELENFLRDQSFAADQVAEYAQECFKFVQSNCGIEKNGD